MTVEVQKFGQNSKLGLSCVRVMKVSRSIHNCGYMVDGSIVTAAILLLWIDS